jgi:hypothetical protein
MISTVLLAVIVLNPTVLFVGNSYTQFNGGIWNMVKQIYDSVESDTLSVNHTTMGGATYQNHWNNRQLLDEIQTGNWNTVVFQEQSCMPVIDPASTYIFGDSLAWLTKASGAQPVFFMTWSRKNDPLMLEGLRAGYSRMGAVHNSPVAPCGMAFDLIRIHHPEIDPYFSDGAHPSLQGSYTAACVIAVTVYGVNLSSANIWQPQEITPENGGILRWAAGTACEGYAQPGGNRVQ